MNIYKIHQSYTDAYKNHCALREVFPNPSRVLYQQIGSKLLVFSDLLISPDGFLIEHLGNTNDVSFSGDVAFSIRLNAAKANKHKRFTVPDDKIIDWVQWKLRDLDCHTLVINNDGVMRSERKGSYCFHSSVFVRGFARNVAGIKEGIEKGIGSGKAFGFGLLNVFGDL